MDILAHGLWAGAAAKASNIKKVKNQKRPVKLWLTVLFGVFPDLFAFALSFSWSIGSRIFPFIPPIEHVRPDQMEPVTQNGRFVFHLTHALYNISHSLFIFFIAFGIVWMIFRRPIWEMGGWLIHILMDIPSHSYRFFPTPFLWPISDFKVDGISWATPWFMAFNYSSLLIVYLGLYLIKRAQNLTKNKN
jgi:hypothetical protein